MTRATVVYDFFLYRDTHPASHRGRRGGNPRAGTRPPACTCRMLCRLRAPVESPVFAEVTRSFSRFVRVVGDDRAPHRARHS